MFRKKCPILVAFCLLCTVGAESRCEPRHPPGENHRVLVLHNGRVLNGTITELGDYYTVELSNRGELRVPASKVDFVCRSMAEAYKIKSESADGAKLDDQVQLAEWCLTNRLIDHAANHLLLAMAIDASDPRVQQVERMWQYANRPAKRSVADPKRHPVRVDLASMDDAIRELSSQEIQLFTTSVQPILLNFCSTNKCHGPNTDSEFRLVGTARGQILGRNMTRQNLFQTLQQIDRQSLQKSRLLTKPTSPHGPASQAIFDERSKQQFDQLVNWVAAVVAHDAESRPNRVEDVEATLSQRDGSNPAGKTDPDTASEDDNAVDPFDPEIFNRRYHAEKQE